MRYKSTIAQFITDGGNYAIDFEADNGLTYRYEFDTAQPRIYYDTVSILSQMEEEDLRAWERKPLHYNDRTWPDMVRKFINASFMEWRDLVEIENAN